MAALPPSGAGPGGCVPPPDPPGAVPCLPYALSKEFLSSSCTTLHSWLRGGLPGPGLPQAPAAAAGRAGGEDQLGGDTLHHPPPGIIPMGQGHGAVPGVLGAAASSAGGLPRLSLCLRLRCSLSAGPGPGLCCFGCQGSASALLELGRAARLSWAWDSRGEGARGARSPCLCAQRPPTPRPLTCPRAAPRGSAPPSPAAASSSSSS